MAAGERTLGFSGILLRRGHRVFFMFSDKVRHYQDISNAVDFIRFTEKHTVSLPGFNRLRSKALSY